MYDSGMSKDSGEGATTGGGEKKKAVVKAAPKTRTLREVKLDVPIRYVYPHPFCLLL
jgi:hypothetical protein